MGHFTIYSGKKVNKRPYFWPLTPLLAEKQFTLAETAAAHDYAEQGKPMGKVVITV